VFQVGTTVLHMEHPSPTPAQIAAAVSGRMDSAGMSLRQVARGANIPLSTFSRRLNGSPFLSTELAALASVFGVTVSQLVAEAEAIPPTTSGAA
jgi:transcriptional regulator with XRE-family HTH domain